MNSSYTIGVIGLWHLGEIYSAGLSEIGHRVIGISDDAELVGRFAKKMPPLPEPGLEKLLADNFERGRLEYTVDIGRVSECNVVWLTFDTPVDENDDIDLSPIYEAVDRIIPHLQEGVLMVVSSQIPVGTSTEIMDRIRRVRPELTFRYAYTPENLRLGEAVRCFMEPVRIVVGAAGEEAFLNMKDIFTPLKAEIIQMSPASAEMAKHALNAFLASSICFANDLADIAEEVGADMLDVSRALHSDPRIGPRAYVDAGLSFSGGTLNRDIKVLRGLAQKYNIHPSVIATLYEKNEARKKLVPEKLAKLLGGLTGKTISLLGLTYKPGTKTLRRSHALEIAKELVVRGAVLRLHDPQAEEKEIGIPAVFSRDVYEASRGAHAVVVVTSWPEFKEIDFSKLAASAAPGAIFFDTFNFLSSKEKAIADAGFRYIGIGRGTI